MEITTKIFLRKGAQHRVESGHPWVYQSEIDYVDGEFEPGDIVDVFNFRQRFIGRGYINPRSQIIVRILSRQQEEIDKEFFKRRILAAWRYRQTFLSEPEYCRLVYGEADFLPALIIDKFGKYMVMQTLALGIDVHKETIVSVLEELFAPEGIYERNDVPVRKLEGLDMRKGYLKGNFPTQIIVNENGIPFYADIENGQKTGFFTINGRTGGSYNLLSKMPRYWTASAIPGRLPYIAHYTGPRNFILLTYRKTPSPWPEKMLN